MMIRIVSPDAPETVCGWSEFAAANDPETVEDVASQIMELGAASLGGGAAPLVLIELVEADHAR